MGLCDINGNSISINTSGSIITGQKICIIGDSNMQYSGNVVKEYLESNYGCTVSVLATAGSTWEINSSGDNYSGIGRVNSLIANADGETKLCSDYDKVIIMLGTNCNSEGETTDTSEQTDTMCGAIRYCLEQLAYYYRKGKVGVILPPQRADGNSWQEPRN